jgi:hypothetical protein
VLINFCRLNILLLLITTGLAGCNTGEDQIPPDTTVEIFPAYRTWEIPDDGLDTCTIYPSNYVDNLFTIRVLDGGGRPLGNVELMISLALAENTLGLNSFVELYDDKDGDFIPDPDELVSGEDDPLFFSRTDKYNGSKTVIVRSNLSCEYGALLSVVAKGAANEVEIDVSKKQ